MNKKAPFFLLLALACILFISPYCSGNPLVTEKNVITYYDVFEGESENWEGEFVLNEAHIFTTSRGKTSYYGKDEYRLSITHRDNFSELSAPKQITFSYKVDLPYNIGSTKTIQTSDFDISKEEYTITNYNFYQREYPTKLEGPVSTQTICSVKDQWRRPEVQKLDSEGIPYVPSGWGFTRYFRWKGIGNYPHVLKGPEQYLVIWHTVDFCPRYNNLYVHHEGSGGTGIDPDSKVLVTVELDGFVETMELKSIL